MLKYIHKVHASLKANYRKILLHLVVMIVSFQFRVYVYPLFVHQLALGIYVCLYYIVWKPLGLTFIVLQS